MHNPATDALQGLTVLERGWLSSNNVLLHGGQAGAVLVDSGHLLHAGQTVALVRQALAKAGGERWPASSTRTCIPTTAAATPACRPRWAAASRCRQRGSWDAASLWDEDR
jgi:hypothetical protein